MHAPSQAVRGVGWQGSTAAPASQAAEKQVAVCDLGDSRPPRAMQKQPRSDWSEEKKQAPAHTECRASGAFSPRGRSGSSAHSAVPSLSTSERSGSVPVE